uniref:Uncharacterized protein n=1 Tax=Tamarix hispida TaxID=189793 RepID=A0A4P8F9Q3_9CARY|nr:hypothetical protein [Tamarix hispida]
MNALPQLFAAPTGCSSITPTPSLPVTRFIPLKRRIHHISHFDSSSNCSPFPLLKPITLSVGPQFTKSLRLSILCCSNNTRNASVNSDHTAVTNSVDERVYSNELDSRWNVEVVNPNVSSYILRLSGSKYSLSDQAFFLLAFIACTTSVAFAGFVAAAVPTLSAMTKAATSLAKLADTAREELPGTMAAIRLSGMEISDLTLELSDLSQEISDGVTKSTQIVQAAETGVRQIGTIAREHTVCINDSGEGKPSRHFSAAIYIGAAKKTSRAVGQATRSLMNFISREDIGSEDEDGSEEDGMEY